jgi:hypothetical protein
VLGRLLSEGIEAHKAYTRHPGYDLIAVNPGDRSHLPHPGQESLGDRLGSQHLSSRTSESDFVAVVALNRGWRGYGRAARGRCA